MACGKKKKEPEVPSDDVFDLKPNLTDVWHYADGLDKTLIACSFILAVGAGFGMPMSMVLFGDVFDGIGTGDSDAVTTITRLMVGIGAGVGLLMFLATYLMELSVARQLKVMRENYFNTILCLDMGFHDTNQVSLYTKLTAALVAFKDGAGFKVVQVTLFVSMFIGGFIIGFVRSWELTLVLFIPIPFMMGGGYVFASLAKNAKAKEEQRFAKINDSVEEAINSIKTVIAFGLEPLFANRFRHDADEIVKEFRKSSLKISVALGSVLAIMFLSYAIGFWYTGVLVRRDVVDPCCLYNPYPKELKDTISACATLGASLGGVFPASGPGSDCSSFSSDLFMEIDKSIRGEWFNVDFEGTCPDKVCFSGGRALGIFFAVVFGAMGLGQAGPAMSAFVKGAGAVTSLKTLTSMEKKLDPLVDKPNAKPALAGDIVLSKLNFAYPTRPDAKIFSELELTIPHGKTTALVGGSGCGKSTIIQLLMRYYDYGAGSISSGGTDLRDMAISDWRSKMAIIPQEPRLFSSSILENIRMGNRKATDEECIRAAMQANAHEFIMGFPDTYHTFAGVGGGQLSGGQKQRICIARALLKNPEILILDEATSALDNKSEATVQATLDKILETSVRTTIVIAHRLSTVRTADHIAVLERQGDAGSIVVESGTHASLMAKESIFYELVKKQELEGLGELVKGEQVDITINEDVLKSAAYKVEHSAPPDMAAQSKKQKKEEAKAKKKAEKLEAKNNKPPMKRFWGEMMSGLMGFFFIAIFFSILNGLSFPLYAVFFGNFLGCVYSPSAQYIKDESAKWALAFVGLAALVFVAATGQEFFFSKVMASAQFKMRTQAYEAVLNKDMSYHDKPENNSGTLVELLAKDIHFASALVASNVGAKVQAAACFVIAVGIGFWANWKLALAGIGSAILTGIGAALEFATNDATTEIDDSIGSPGFLFSETILNIKTIGAFNLQHYMIGQFKIIVDHESKKEKTGAAIKGVAVGLSQFFQFCGNAFIFWIGSILMKAGDIGTDVDSLTRFNIALFALQFAGFGVAIAMQSLTDEAKAVKGVNRLYAVLDRESKIDPRVLEGATTDIMSGKGIEFDDVCFSYPTRNEVPIYDSISALFPTGKTTALVGTSGCGKSTAIQLLMRLYDPVVPYVDPAKDKAEYDASSPTAMPRDSYDDGPGSVLIHTPGASEDLRSLQVRSLRSQLGLVGQEPVLFDMTILENIRWGNMDATEEDCIAAAKASNAYDFIAAFPEGFETTVGKMGSKLSGGQKQRIAIARALVRKPSVLLLDEATSALDSESEKIVQAALEKITQENAGKMSVVVIAHRLSTIKGADQILVFDTAPYGAQIVERGTHAELVAIDGGVYQQLCMAAT